MSSLLALYLISLTIGSYATFFDEKGYSNFRTSAATHVNDPPTSQGLFINSGTPDGVPVSFDCAARAYAYQYGQQIQPRHGKFVDLFDALQLQACNHTRPEPQARYIPNYNKITSIEAACTFYVDPVNGKDSNDGSATSPFLTIIHGITATRNARTGTEQCILNLMKGVFYQTETIVLTNEDNNLVIQNYNGADVTISGGKPIEFSDNQWTLYNFTETVWKNYTAANNVWGRADAGTSNDLIRFVGKFNSYAACFAAALQASTTSEGPFHSLTWHNLQQDGYEGLCYGIRDISWQPNFSQDGIYSARFIGKNIWSRTVSNYGDLLDSTIYGLRVNDRRAIRARYPDQDPETAMQYDPVSGWIGYDTAWNPPAHVPNAKDITQTAKDWPGVEWPMDGPGGTPWTGEGDWGEFFQGLGGPCADMEPNFGYWCAHDAPRQIEQHESPSAVYLSTDFMEITPDLDVSDAVVQAWRPNHWYTWMWNAGNYNKQKLELQFSKGGFQGGEGEKSGAEWYIENVFQFLDSPAEYFYNRTTHKLYYFYNSTGRTPPPSDTQFIATNNKRLFNITGTMDKPVKDITIQGVTMRDTPYTYMDPHGLPSGGDWAIQRQGAITLEGTENVTISSNLFTRLDGIGIFLSGYNRYALIDNNEFEWIGDSAMAAWGYTRGLESELPGGGPDGRTGEQPRFTTISNNLVREIGIWEKQSSMWFQAQTCQTTIRNNVFFNGPRAAVNVNDGFGGNNEMVGNLLMNTCRESGDHGPWNSWDRVPYITTVGSGKASIIPGFNNIHNNFIIGNYQSQSGVDTDDGSSYYTNHDNFYVYGDFGIKSDFGGHDNYHYNNVYSYIGNWYLNCCTSGFNNKFQSNQCVLRVDNSYSSNCKLPPGSENMQISNNSIFLPSGRLEVCGMSFSNWQAQGNDPGTTINKIPSDQEIIQFGKAKLQNN